MRNALARLNADLMEEYPDYVCRVTSDEGDIGSAHRANFQDIDRSSPVILTTSQLLTTGVDAPTCKNVVLARVVGSMSEFKQIIGRGTLSVHYGKLAFNIIDYTGSATEKFADPAFDGDPVREREEIIDRDGDVVEQKDLRAKGDVVAEYETPDISYKMNGFAEDNEPGLPRKFYYDGGSVSIIRQLVYELNSEGRQLACAI